MSISIGFKGVVVVEGHLLHIHLNCIQCGTSGSTGLLNILLPIQLNWVQWGSGSSVGLLHIHMNYVQGSNVSGGWSISYASELCPIALLMLME